jgi:outer membrane immunogenic protein
MKIKIAAFVLATAACAWTASARADGLTSAGWDGLFVSASAGYGWSDSQHTIEQSASLDDIPLGSIKDSSHFNTDGAIGAIGVGYDWRLYNNFVAGIFSDYTFGDTKDSYSVFGVPITANYDNIWAVGGRLGYLVLPNTLLFATGGYTNADLRLSNEGGSLKYNLDGYFVGGGLEQKLADHVFFKVEYRFSGYQDAKESETDTESCGCEEGDTFTATTSSRVSNDIHSIRFGIVLKLDDPTVLSAK